MAFIRPREWTAAGRRVRKFEVEYRNAAGERRRRLFATFAAARSFRGEVESAPPAATEARPVVALEAAGRRWIAAVKRDGRAHATWSKYESHLERHITPTFVDAGDVADARPFGSFALAEITTPVVVRFKQALQTRGLSGAMVQKVMASLRMLFNAAQLEGLTANNPASPVRARRGEREKPRIRPPEPEEVRALLAAVNGHDGPPALGQVWINLAPATGLRPGEMRALVWDAVALDAKPPYLEVRHAADSRGVIGAPKSTAGRRRVPLPASVAALLRRWQAACPKSAPGLVFPTAAGNVQNLSNIHNRIWRPLLERLGMIAPDTGKRDASGELVRDKVGRSFRPESRFTLYGLRHFYASVQIAAGRNVKELQALMGHESVRLTLDIYGHLFKDERRDAQIAADIEKALTG